MICAFYGTFLVFVALVFVLMFGLAVDGLACLLILVEGFVVILVLGCLISDVMFYFVVFVEWLLVIAFWFGVLV